MILFDSMLNFILFIYASINEDDPNKQIFTLYFWLNLIFQLIVVFFSLIYNEFLVLFICGLEKNTYLDITRRATTIELNINGDLLPIN